MGEVRIRLSIETEQAIKAINNLKAPINQLLNALEKTEPSAFKKLVEFLKSISGQVNQIVQAITKVLTEGINVQLKIDDGAIQNLKKQFEDLINEIISKQRQLFESITASAIQSLNQVRQASRATTTTQPTAAVTRAQLATTTTAPGATTLPDVSALDQLNRGMTDFLGLSQKTGGEVVQLGQDLSGLVTRFTNLDSSEKNLSGTINRLVPGINNADSAFKQLFQGIKVVTNAAGSAKLSGNVQPQAQNLQVGADLAKGLSDAQKQLLNSVRVAFNQSDKILKGELGAILKDEANTLAKALSNALGQPVKIVEQGGQAVLNVAGQFLPIANLFSASQKEIEGAIKLISGGGKKFTAASQGIGTFINKFSADEKELLAQVGKFNIVTKEFGTAAKIAADINIDEPLRNFVSILRKRVEALAESGALGSISSEQMGAKATGAADVSRVTSIESASVGSDDAARIQANIDALRILTGAQGKNAEETLRNREIFKALTQEAAGQAVVLQRVADIYKQLASSQALVDKSQDSFNSAIARSDSVLSNTASSLQQVQGALIRISSASGEGRKAIDSTNTSIAQLQSLLGSLSSDGVEGLTASQKRLFASFTTADPITEIKKLIQTNVDLRNNLESNFSALENRKLRLTAFKELREDVTGASDTFRNRAKEIIRGISDIRGSLSTVNKGNIQKTFDNIGKDGNKLIKDFVNIKTSFDNLKQTIQSQPKSSGVLNAGELKTGEQALKASTNSLKAFGLEFSSLISQVTGIKGFKLDLGKLIELGDVGSVQAQISAALNFKNVQVSAKGLKANLTELKESIKSLSSTDVGKQQQLQITLEKSAKSAKAASAEISRLRKELEANKDSLPTKQYTAYIKILEVAELANKKANITLDKTKQALNLKSQIDQTVLGLNSFVATGNSIKTVVSSVGTVSASFVKLRNEALQLKGFLSPDQFKVLGSALVSLSDRVEVASGTLDVKLTNAFREINPTLTDFGIRLGEIIARAGKLGKINSSGLDKFSQSIFTAFNASSNLDKQLKTLLADMHGLNAGSQLSGQGAAVFTQRIQTLSGATERNLNQLIKLRAELQLNARAFGINESEAKGMIAEIDRMIGSISSARVQVLTFKQGLDALKKSEDSVVNASKNVSNSLDIFKQLSNLISKIQGSGGRKSEIIDTTSIQEVSNEFVKLVNKVGDARRETERFNKVIGNQALVDAGTQSLKRLGESATAAGEAIRSKLSNSLNAADIAGDAKKVEAIIGKIFAKLSGGGGGVSPKLGTDFANQLVSSLERASNATKSIDEIKTRIKSVGGAGKLSSQEVDVFVTEIGRLSQESKRANNQLIDLSIALRKSGAALGLTEKEVKDLNISLTKQRVLLNVNQEALAKTGKRLKDVQGANQNAKQGIDGYSASLSKSIIQNSIFANSFFLIFGAIQAVRNAIESVVELDAQVARVISVTRSLSLSVSESAKVISEEMNDAVKQFGLSVEEVGNVLKEFGSAGLVLEESLAALNSTLEAIVATEAEAGEFVRTLAGVFSVLGDSIDGATDRLSRLTIINNTFVRAFQESQLELQELTNGFKFSSAAAAVVGVSFNELTAILALLNNNLIKSGQAGRSLQSIFAQIATKREQFAQAFNIEIDADAPLDFIKILEQVSTQFERGAITAGRVEEVFSLLGLRGARSFIVLAQQFEGFNDLLSDFEVNASTAASVTANIRLDTIEAQFNRLKETLLEFSRVIISIFTGEQFQAIRIAIESLSAIVNGLTGAYQKILANPISGFLLRFVAVVFAVVLALKLFKLAVSTLGGVLGLNAEFVGRFGTRLAAVGVIAKNTTRSLIVTGTAITTTGGGAQIAAIGVRGLSVATFGLANAVRVLLGPIGLAVAAISLFGFVQGKAARTSDGLTQELDEQSSQLLQTRTELNSGALSYNRLTNAIRSATRDAAAFGASTSDLAGDLRDSIQRLAQGQPALEEFLSLDDAQLVSNVDRILSTIATLSDNTQSALEDNTRRLRENTEQQAQELINTFDNLFSGVDTGIDELIQVSDRGRATGRAAAGLSVGEDAISFETNEIRESLSETLEQVFRDPRSIIPEDDISNLTTFLRNFITENAGRDLEDLTSEIAQIISIDEDILVNFDEDGIQTRITEAADELATTLEASANLEFNDRGQFTDQIRELDNNADDLRETIGNLTRAFVLFKTGALAPLRQSVAGLSSVQFELINFRNNILEVTEGVPESVRRNVSILESGIEQFVSILEGISPVAGIDESLQLTIVLREELREIGDINDALEDEVERFNQTSLSSVDFGVSLPEGVSGTLISDDIVTDTNEILGQLRNNFAESLDFGEINTRNLDGIRELSVGIDDLITQPGLGEEQSRDVRRFAGEILNAALFSDDLRDSLFDVSEVEAFENQRREVHALQEALSRGEVIADSPISFAPVNLDSINDIELDERSILRRFGNFLGNLNDSAQTGIADIVSDGTLQIINNTLDIIDSQSGQFEDQFGDLLGDDFEPLFDETLGNFLQGIIKTSGEAGFQGLARNVGAILASELNLAEFVQATSQGLEEGIKGGFVPGLQNVEDIQIGGINASEITNLEQLLSAVNSEIEGGADRAETLNALFQAVGINISGASSEMQSIILASAAVSENFAESAIQSGRNFALTASINRELGRRLPVSFNNIDNLGEEISQLDQQLALLEEQESAVDRRARISTLILKINEAITSGLEAENAQLVGLQQELEELVGRERQRQETEQQRSERLRRQAQERFRARERFENQLISLRNTVLETFSAELSLRQQVVDIETRVAQIREEARRFDNNGLDVITQQLALLEEQFSIQLDFIEALKERNDLEQEGLESLLRIQNAGNDNAASVLDLRSGLRQIVTLRDRLNSLATIEGESTNEILETRNELIGVYGEILELSENLSEVEDHQFDTLEARLGVLSSLSSVLSDRVGTVQDQIGRLLTVQQERNPFSFAVDGLRELGEEIGSTVPDDLIERLVDRASEIPGAFANATDEVRALTDTLLAFEERRRQIEEQRIELLLRQAQIQERIFQAQVDAGDIEGALQTASTLSGAFTEIADFGGIDFAVEGLEDLNSTLAQLSSVEVTPASLGFEPGFLDQAGLTLEEIRAIPILAQQGLDEFGGQFIQEGISNLGTFEDTLVSLSNESDSLQSSLLNTFRNIAQDENILVVERLFDAIADSSQRIAQLDGLRLNVLIANDLEGLSERSQRSGGIKAQKGGLVPARFQDGGTVGGSGSGDIIPALLEPGEFVVPRDVVRSVGTLALDLLKDGELEEFAQAVFDFQRNEKLLRRNELSFNDFLNATEDVFEVTPTAHLGFQDGGQIPGFGGGDIVPALLEPGEFVLPKAVTRLVGSDLLELLKDGNVATFVSQLKSRKIAKFKTGGVVGGRKEVRGYRSGGVVGGRKEVRGYQSGGIVSGGQAVKGYAEGGIIADNGTEFELGNVVINLKDADISGFENLDAMRAFLQENNNLLERLINLNELIADAGDDLGGALSREQRSAVRSAPEEFGLGDSDIDSSSSREEVAEALQESLPDTIRETLKAVHDVLNNTEITAPELSEFLSEVPQVFRTVADDLKKIVEGIDVSAASESGPVVDEAQLQIDRDSVFAQREVLDNIESSIENVETTVGQLIDLKLEELERTLADFQSSFSNRFSAFLEFRFLGAIEENIKAVIDRVTNLVDRSLNIWIALFDSVTDVSDDFEDDSRKNLDEGVNDLNKALRRNQISYFDYLNGLEDLFDEFNKAQIDALREQLKKQQEEYDAFLNFVAGRFGDVGQLFADAGRKGLERLGEDFRDFAVGEINNFVEKLIVQFTQLNSVGEDIGKGIEEGLKDAEGAVRNFSQKLRDGLLAAIDPATWARIAGDGIRILGEGLSSVGRIFGNGLKSVFEFAGNAFKTAIIEVLPKILKAIKDGLVEAFKFAAEALKSVLSFIVEDLGNAIMSVFTADFWAGIGEGLGNAVSNFGDGLKNASDNLGESLNGIADEAKENFGSIFEGAGSELEGTASRLSSALDESGISPEELLAFQGAGRESGLGQSLGSVTELDSEAIGDSITSAFNSVEDIDFEFDPSAIGDSVDEALQGVNLEDIDVNIDANAIGDSVGEALDGVNLDDIDVGVDVDAIGQSVGAALDGVDLGDIDVNLDTEALEESLGSASQGIKESSKELGVAFEAGTQELKDGSGLGEDNISGPLATIALILRTVAQLAFAIIQNLGGQLLRIATKPQEVVDKAVGFVEQLPEAIGSIVNRIEENIPVIVDAVVKAMPQVIDALIEAIPVLISALIEGLSALAPALIEQLPVIVDALVQGIIAFLPQIGTLLGEVISSLLVAIPKIILLLVAAIPDIIVGFVQAAVNIFTELISSLPLIISGIVELLPVIITEVAELVPELISTLIAALPQLVVAVAEAIPLVLESLLESIPEIVEALIEAIPTIIGGFIEAIPQLLEALVVAIPAIVLGLLNSVFSIVKAIFFTFPILIGEAIAAGFSKLFSPSFWIKAFKGLGNFLKNIFKAIGRAILSPFRAIRDFFRNLGNPFRKKKKKHDGGIIRKHEGGVISKDDNSVLAGFGGLRQDEVPAILLTREGVLNREGLLNLGGEAVLNALNSGAMIGDLMNGNRLEAPQFSPTIESLSNPFTEPKTLSADFKGIPGLNSTFVPGAASSPSGEATSSVDFSGMTFKFEINVEHMGTTEGDEDLDVVAGRAAQLFFSEFLTQVKNRSNVEVNQAMNEFVRGSTTNLPN